jgi:L-ascorbate metabolism protein UlaG (beta-lactamase superfamily)
LTAPALQLRELPRIDLILLSHAHFDHFDLRTLHRFDERTSVVTAPNTADLLKWTHLRDITELHWGETKVLKVSRQTNGDIAISAFQVRHWGARKQRDDYRGYNGYVVERNRRRILFGGDTAMTDTFANVQQPINLAIMSIGAYNPWIRSHSTPEQAVEMATAAGAQFIMPVHHQTFRLSFEPLGEPIARFQAALRKTPERIALREIGETFVLPL